jgi:hypothetical protein
MTRYLIHRPAWPHLPIVAILLVLFSFNPLQAQTSNVPPEADKLHVVLLVAGHDEGIGNADMMDIAAMKRTINSAFAKDKNRLVYHDFTGTNAKTGQVFTSKDILARLRNLKIGTNDSVLVFHSGHGGIADKARPEETHILTVDGGQLHRKDIRNILAANVPRALTILTDCCSVFLNAPKPKNVNPVAKPITISIATSAPLMAASSAYGVSPESQLRPLVFDVHMLSAGTLPDTQVQNQVARPNAATVRNLLLRSRGLVNITAAQDGTEALASAKGANPAQAGSAFTVALTRLWYKMDVTYASWPQMFPVLQTETFQASGGAHQARAFQIGAAQQRSEPRR